ncbi:hypothetical protein [Cupriavidus sp. H39]|uniref:hypothetical protein n=1 Tax=Cupriavidus sp. H39 TaxID=3401635 RepID=UPI003D06E32F
MNTTKKTLPDAEIVFKFKKRRSRLLIVLFPGFVVLFLMLASKVDIKIYLLTFIPWFLIGGSMGHPTLLSTIWSCASH